MYGTLGDDLKKAMLNAFAALFNGGSIQFQTSGHAAVSTVSFNATAFGSATGTGTVTITANTTPNALEDADCTGNAGNDVTHAHLRKSDATEMASLTVGTSNADCILSAVRIQPHDFVRLSSVVFSL